MKIPTIVKEAQTSLENGCCVVIGLQSTGEVHVQGFTKRIELVPISLKIGRMNFNVCKVEEIFTCRLYKFSFHLFDFLGFI